MGCNYFIKKGACPTCGHGETIHIGKSSGGWVFNLRVYLGENPPIKSLDDWKTLFVDPRNRIVDEYGDQLTADMMLDVITNREGFVDPKSYPPPSDCEYGPKNLLRPKMTSMNRVFGHGENNGTWSYCADDHTFTEASW